MFMMTKNIKNEKKKNDWGKYLGVHVTGYDPTSCVLHYASEGS